MTRRDFIAALLAGPVLAKAAFTADAPLIVRPPGLGLSVHMIKRYHSVGNYQFPMRLDVLYGWNAINPRWSARITA